MAKRQVEFDDTSIKFAVWAIGAAFAAYLFIDSLYIDDNELRLNQQPQDAALIKSQEDFNRKIIMAESARYMELIQYYSNKGELTEAEDMRLANVEYMHCRLSKELAGQDPDMCVYQ